MTTYSTNTRIRHDSDANFREWMNEFHTALTTVGAVQTADTGQINMATATRAGVNSDAGYSIYYMNDSLHGTAPVYFKLYWGTAAATDRARLRLEIGTGSNGTGSITGGDASVRTISSNSSSSLSTDTTYPLYACMARGALWIASKIGRPSASYAYMGFGIFRNCDATGAADSTGIFCMYHGAGSSTTTSFYHQRLYFATSSWSTYTNANSFHWPGPDTSSTADEDGNVQFMIPFYGMLRPRPFNNWLIAFGADMTQTNTYSLTGIGSTAFTYMALDKVFGQGFTVVGLTHNMGFLAVYE